MALPQDGVNANALAKVTTIPTGKELIFIDPTTNEGGVITLEDLTKQILQNLTSQTFTLDQGTKTLPAALNELNSKSQTLNFVYCRTKTKVGMIDIDENNLVNGTVPSSANYIPVIIGHSKSNRSQDNIFFDNLKWHITSDTEQEINIRFYKCAK